MRVSWDKYFLDIALCVATRATCDRKHVGAVIVSPRRHILATGYNGSMPGDDHCDDVGHLMEDGHCVRTIHAEVNAIAQAASNGVSVHGAAIYITASPCWPCFKLIVGAGVRRIAFGEFYRDEKIFAAALRGGVELVDLTGVFRPVEIDPGAKKVTNTDIARGYVGGGRHEPGGMLDPNSKDD